MIELCSDCRFFSSIQRKPGSGVCNRYPQAVEVSESYSCGEWQPPRSGVDVRDMTTFNGLTRTAIASGDIDAGDLVKQVSPGVVEAVDRIESVKRGKRK